MVGHDVIDIGEHPAHLLTEQEGLRRKDTAAALVKVALKAVAVIAEFAQRTEVGAEGDHLVGEDGGEGGNLVVFDPEPGEISAEMLHVRVGRAFGGKHTVVGHGAGNAFKQCVVRMAPPFAASRGMLVMRVGAGLCLSRRDLVDINGVKADVKQLCDDLADLILPERRGRTHYRQLDRTAVLFL